MGGGKIAGFFAVIIAAAICILPIYIMIVFVPNYLIVWEELRHGSMDIYAARVTQSGEVLDPEGIRITMAPASQIKPSVAFDGINFLVVWADGRNGPADIYGARVSTGGEVIDPEGIPISTAGGTQSYPAVEWSGSRYMVVWSDERRGWVDIYAARLDTDGTVLEQRGSACQTTCFRCRYSFYTPWFLIPK